MELKDHRFYCGGSDMHFSIFSNSVCRARYFETIRVPYGDSMINVYSVEPSSQCRWVVILQEGGGHSHYKWFVRKGNALVERLGKNISRELKAEIFHKFSNLARRTDSTAA